MQDASAADALAASGKPPRLTAKLYVAHFKADGAGEWVELSINNARSKTAPQAAAFADQADA